MTKLFLDTLSFITFMLFPCLSDVERWPAGVAKFKGIRFKTRNRSNLFDWKLQRDDFFIHSFISPL